MIWCPHCNKRLHQECIIDDIVERYSDDIAGVETFKPPKKTSQSARRQSSGKKGLKGSDGQESPVTIQITGKSSVARAFYQCVDGEKKEASIICLVCKSDLS